jgi:SAM-dependent methyltransferase
MLGIKENEFDAKAKCWDSDPAKVERARIVANAIREEIKNSREFTAFEYGCGTGLVSFFLQPFLKKIVLADNSSGMVEILEDKIRIGSAKNMFPVNLDLSRENPPEEKFHLIYTLMALHHIHDTREILSTFYSILNSDGYICIVDLDREDGSFHGDGFDGHNGFDRESLVALAGKIGFRNIRFRTVLEVSKIVKGNEKRSFPLFLMTAQKQNNQKPKT